MASSWFIKYTKKQKADPRILSAAIGNILSDLLYKYFPLSRNIKKDLASKENAQ